MEETARRWDVGTLYWQSRIVRRDPVADYEIPDDIAADVETMFDVSKIPDDERLRLLSSRCQRLALVSDRIDRLKKDLEGLEAEKNKLARHELPDLFDRCHTDRIGVPGEDVDVVVEPIYHANIKSDWPEQQREVGFDSLERCGGGDLIRVTMEVGFGRGELELARAAAEHLKKWNEFGNREIRISRGVPWNTLTSFVREQIEAGNPMPMEDLGATFGRVCKIKKRNKGKR